MRRLYEATLVCLKSALIASLMGCLWGFFSPAFGEVTDEEGIRCIVAEIPDELGVRCVVGESSSQGFSGMVAVADALQNRGTIKGVYGCKAKHTEPAYIWERARRAWQEAKVQNPTQGADHWHNVVREGENYWTRKLTKTVCIKDHCFYK